MHVEGFVGTGRSCIKRLKRVGDRTEPWGDSVGQAAQSGRHASEFKKGMTPRQEVPQPFNIVGVDGSVHQLGNQTVSWYGIECLADVHCSCQVPIRRFGSIHPFLGPLSDATQQ